LPGDTVLIQGNCHNPTGVDLTDADWVELWEFSQKKQLVLLVDIAFVGMGKGVVEDFLPFRDWANRLQNNALAYPKVPFFLAVSYSKCFTMYNARVGSLSIVSE
jgi:aromatic-amino-acid transaminase